MNKIIPNFPRIPLNQVHEHFDHADLMHLHQTLLLHPQHPLNLILSIVYHPLLPPIICNYVPVMYVTRNHRHIRSFFSRQQSPARSFSILYSMNYHRNFSRIIPMNFINMIVHINASFMLRKIFINYLE